MRRFHLSICLASLTLLFSACSVAELTTPKQTQLNESLPKVQSLKSISDLSNVAFEWEPLYSENIQGFYLYRSSEKEPQMKLVATIKDKFQTHYVDTKLESGTKYQYMMKTFNEQGHFSEEGQVIEIATQPRPEPLAFVQAIINLPGRIKLIWRPHTDLRVNAYIIEKKKVEDKKFAKIGEVKNRLSAEFIDEVKANENFLYRVSALTFDGVQSEPSEVLNSTSKALPPEITHLSASNDLNGKIMLSWDAPVYEDFSYFKIYATSSSFLPFTLLAKTDKNSYEDIVQGAGESKQYKITMVDKDGLESPMPKKGVEGKTLGLPASPSIILAQITNEGIVLEWVDNDNRAVEYEVKRYGGDQNAIFKGIKEKRLRDIKALAGVEYSYEVIGIDELGQRSAPSSKVKAAQ
ncbi:fibronectin type III domain-containing protein [Campylobacter upsaliensis]|uniref:fibronectin type III domain-containing protein n=1 Tax=Campylobacter upsaliensis TaxID=28080 RepID=UPI00004B3883|nr:fibronectin type III domain-containing protein [Campylobacter upsaliensis]EAL53051.1 Fibronectin type III domain protein [Campylobacter upsaliensis RM3195]EHE0558851.1 fibronectin type III domain-containing protein [Campylobacter upsaliensis]MCR2098561.1 fibronectin type III domain-containing protein [Campylobacter upsaliensis]MCR2102898.1 fibronectin type III domain-containing protein [Campylobacter upsaliensis]MCR2108492.1 fibronectin type III domain-containing protein [Campylobacter upsa